MQGLINAFDMPGRQSFLVQMVEDRADLATPSPSTPPWSTPPASSAPPSPPHHRWLRRRLVLRHRRHQLPRRHRQPPPHAHQARRNPPRHPHHARADARRLDLRQHLPPRPHHPSSLLLLSLMGWPFMVPAPHLRLHGPARRPTHPRLPHRSLRRRSTGQRPLARRPQKTFAASPA